MEVPIAIMVVLFAVFLGGVYVLYGYHLWAKRKILEKILREHPERMEEL